MRAGHLVWFSTPDGQPGRSLGGRLFGYGEFIIESAGQDQALRNIPFIPYPEQLYVEVCKLLFPDEEAREEIGEDRGDD